MNLYMRYSESVLFVLYACMRTPLASAAESGMIIISEWLCISPTEAIRQGDKPYMQHSTLLLCSVEQETINQTNQQTHCNSHSSLLKTLCGKKCEQWFQSARTVPGQGWKPNRTIAVGLATWKCWTVALGPVTTGIPGPCKPSIFPPIRYLSSHHIPTWSIRESCSFWRSFTWWSAMLNPTIIRCVAVENPQFGRDFEWYFRATQWILIGVQIGDPGVKAHLILHISCIDHVLIR